MPDPISALECEPSDLIREVSPEAINFYVDGLGGLYLHDDFKEEHADVSDIKFWKPEDRLHGKFGRFALRHAQESEENENEPLDDILLMGTTVGLSGLDEYQDLHSLRHYDLADKVREVLEERDLPDSVVANAVDYGATSIKLRRNGIAKAISVSGNSFDFGRASADGRQTTCEVFGQLLGGEIQVFNIDPEPRDFDDILR